MQLDCGRVVDLQEGMPRRLRIQERNALYHVINRGNYRSDVFESEGACEAFERVLAAACERYEWKIHAYVIMRNHFHLALETPLPNLAEGMHWLLGTFAVRFNRFRKEQGHVFQGRYRALLIENAAALARVADYIHLNPVRAHAVLPVDVACYRWGSLKLLPAKGRPDWLMGTDVLRQRGLSDDDEGWAAYISRLITLAADEQEQIRLGFDRMTKGWAIGTTGWRRAVARELDAMDLAVGADQSEINSLKEMRWAAALAAGLKKTKRRASDLARDRKGAPWKRELAIALRESTGASCSWIAKNLHMGNPASVRVYVCEGRQI